MPMKKLTEDEVSEVRRWLFEQKINPNKINREFSDCVALAQLLKKFYPKMIDLHNYPSRNSTQLKLNNWETLNNKVLDRLGIHVTKSMMDKLSKAVPGAIESLLCEVMLMEKSSREPEKKEENYQEQIWTENDDVLTVPVNKKVGDAIVQVPQKMILYSIYEQKVRESNAKDTLLVAAQQKVAHVENILRLKTERIEELCGQLVKLSVRTILKQTKLDKPGPSSDAALDKIENECCD